MNSYSKWCQGFTVQYPLWCSYSRASPERWRRHTCHFTSIGFGANHHESWGNLLYANFYSDNRWLLPRFFSSFSYCNYYSHLSRTMYDCFSGCFATPSIGRSINSILHRFHNNNTISTCQYIWYRGRCFGCIYWCRFPTYLTTVNKLSRYYVRWWSGQLWIFSL